MALRLAKPKAKLTAPAVHSGDVVQAVCDFLAETFIVPAGISAGDRFRLHEFQKEFLSAHLETSGGSPRYRSQLLSLPRKTGKSTFVGAMLLAYMLPESPIHRPMFRASITAPTAKFARFIPQAAIDLMTAVGREDEIALRHAPNPGRLVLGNCYAQLLSGDSKSGHGDDVDLAIMDEGGLFPRRQDELFDATRNSLAARDGIQIITGTRLDGPKFSELLETKAPNRYVQLHAADQNADPGDPAQWEKATPGGFKIKSKAFVRGEYDDAKASGNLEDFKTSHLNLPGNPSRELLVDYQTLSLCYQPDPQPIPDEPVYLGLDLGGSASMTAACAVYESGLVRCIGAFPDEPITLAERGKRDAVSDLYVRCALEGSLLTTAGHVTDLDEFLPFVLEMIGSHPVASVSCDRYRREELLNALGRAGLGWQPVFRGQGPKDGDADIRATRKLFLSRTLRLKRTRLLEAGIAEADCKISTTGAVQLERSHKTARIDVAQALVLGCSALFRAKDVAPIEYSVEVI